MKLIRLASALLVFLMLAGSLAACDTGPGPTPTPLAEPTATFKTLPNGVRLDPSVSGTVELWHFWASPVRRNALRRVIALCNAELPNIKVNDVVKPFGGLWDENREAVKAGQGMPDVIVEDRPKISERARDGIDLNLKEWAERDGIIGSQFWDFTWQQSVYEGAPYGIPYETEVRVLFYNKSMFAEAGLDPEAPPQTWADLETIADKLDKRNADGSYARLAFLPILGSASPVTWGYTNGADWINEAGQPIVTEPAAVETLEWVKKWLDRYGGYDKVREFMGQSGPAPNDAFMTGKVAMFVDINGYASQLNVYRPRWQGSAGGTTSLEWGVSDIPYAKTKASWSGGFALSIPSGAPTAAAAWEFIKCATAPSAQSSWARDTYAMPANVSAASDPLLLADPSWKFFVDAMDYTRAGNTPANPQWSNELEARLEPIWRGEISAANAMAELQRALVEGNSSTPTP
jgi:multiple sugar transport system substrate-binding protein